MVNGNNHSMTGLPTSVTSDTAPYRDGVDPVAFVTDTPPGGESAPRVDAADALSLERLAEHVKELTIRLDALIEAVTPVIRCAGVEEDPTTEDVAANGIKAAKEALIYTNFFQEAVRLGMSPGMVSDAYRLADLSKAAADLETKEVTGVKEAADALFEKKPYLFTVRQNDIGSETNPARGPSSYPEQVENLARALGVSPGFAADLVKKRSDKAGGGMGLPEIWRIPRANRLSFLETND